MGSFDAVWHVEDDGRTCGHDTAGRVLELTVRVKSGPPLDLTPEQELAEQQKLAQAANVVNALGLTKIQREIYTIIQQHMVRYPGTEWPSMHRIGLEVGCTRQYVDEVVEVLIRRELLPARPTDRTPVSAQATRDAGSASLLNVILLGAVFGLLPALVGPLSPAVTVPAVILTGLTVLAVIRRHVIRERTEARRARTAITA